MGDALGGLGHRPEPAPGQAVQGADDQARPHPGKGIAEAGGRGLGRDGDLLGDQDGARVHALVHPHDGDPGFAVAGQDRPLDGRRPAPARQQRGVDVEAAEPGRRQDRSGQDQAVGGDDGGVRAKPGEGPVLAVVLQAGRRAHGQTPGGGEGVDGDGPFGVSAPGRPGRLRVDAGHLVARLQQGAQDGHREIGASHEHQAQARHRISRLSECRTGDRRNGPGGSLKGQAGHTAGAVSRRQGRGPGTLLL